MVQSFEADNKKPEHYLDRTGFDMIKSSRMKIFPFTQVSLHFLDKQTTTIYLFCKKPVYRWNGLLVYKQQVYHE
jgi:hypothetical protein